LFGLPSRNLSLGLRYHQTAGEDAYLEEEAVLESPLGDRLTAQLGMRASESSLTARGLGAKAELDFSPALLSLHFRLGHQYFVKDIFSQTVAFLFLESRLPLSSYLDFFTGFGWYERLYNLNSPLPGLSGSRDHDIAAALGFTFRVSSFNSILLISTYDGFDAFNLNHPFASLKLEYDMDAYRFFLESRYQVLLGFGRLDNISFGAGVVAAL
jgi:hypothetical protein